MRWFVSMSGSLRLSWLKNGGAAKKGEKWRSGRWSVHEKLMNYAAEFLISFLSAHGTLRGGGRRDWWAAPCWRGVVYLAGMQEEEQRRPLSARSGGLARRSNCKKGAGEQNNSKIEGRYFPLWNQILRLWEKKQLFHIYFQSADLERAWECIRDLHSWSRNPKIDARAQYWSPAFRPHPPTPPMSRCYLCCHEEKHSHYALRSPWGKLSSWYLAKVSVYACI